MRSHKSSNRVRCTPTGSLRPISFNSISITRSCITNENSICDATCWWRAKMESWRVIGTKMGIFVQLLRSIRWRVSTRWSTWQMMQCRRRVRSMVSSSRGTRYLFSISRGIWIRPTRSRNSVSRTTSTQRWRLLFWNEFVESSVGYNKICVRKDRP